MAFEATTDCEEKPSEEVTEPLLDRSSYPTTNKILARSMKDAETKAMEVVKITSAFSDEDATVSGTVDRVTKKTKPKMRRHLDW